MARLGNPESYAADMRAAAELRPPPGGLIAFLRAPRPRNVLIALALVALAAALAAAIAWARSYQPLGAGSSGLNPIGARQGALGETVAKFQQGQPFQFGFSIRNSGRFAVRILDLLLMHDEFIMPFAVKAFLSSQRLIGKPVSAFQPFTLEPGDEQLIILRGSYANCDEYVAHGSVGLAGMAVRTRFLRWNHTVVVPLLQPLVIRMPGRPCFAG